MRHKVHWVEPDRLKYGARGRIDRGMKGLVRYPLLDRVSAGIEVRLGIGSFMGYSQSERPIGYAIKSSLRRQGVRQ